MDIESVIMKRIFFNLALASAVLIGATFRSEAVPAKTGIVTITQADGSTLNVRLVGDENFHQYYTEDGFLLVNDNGNFCYAKISDNGIPVSSNIRAKDIAERGNDARIMLRSIDKEAQQRAVKALHAEYLKLDSSVILNRKSQLKTLKNVIDSPSIARPAIPGLFTGTHFPSLGSPKTIVILAAFNDVSFSIDQPYDYFNRMLNERDFNLFNGTGSALDFFIDNSDGQFTPIFDVFGPVILPSSQKYYGGNDFLGNDMNPEQMVIDACTAADPYIDFSQYDNDGDGIVDNVFVFYAGRGEADGGGANTVWPHSYNLKYSNNCPRLDGVLIDRYACTNEWDGSRPDGIGTFVHEFSHVLGLPDLYTTSYTGAFTPGRWSTMDQGSYNNNKRTPPYFSVFERAALGWLYPKAIETVTNVTLPPISSNFGAIINTSDKNEFFLFENRQQTGWDKYIPGHGMLVWHIDYDRQRWDNNSVNNISAHQYVDIEEADGVRSEMTRSGDAFPGTANRTSFTDTTSPSMRTWDRKHLNLPITEIAEDNDGIISFHVAGGYDVMPLVEVCDAVDTGDDHFTAVWKQRTGMDYYLSVYTREDSVRNYVPGYQKRFIGRDSLYTVEGLQPETTYFYTLVQNNGWDESGDSEEIPVFTGENTPFELIRAIAREATEIADSSFTANWDEVRNADSYEIKLITPVDTVTAIANGVTHHTFEGLIPETLYSYTVTAIYGNIRTRTSLPVYVTTVQQTNSLADNMWDDPDAPVIFTGEGYIIISGGENSEIAVTATDGQTVYSGRSDGSVEIALLPGLYIVNVGKYVSKVIVD